MEIALISGASSGIGKEFAAQLHRDFGVDEFWFIARRADRMEALARDLGVEARVIAADLSGMEGIRTVTDLLEKERPRVKYLINAAGFGKFGSYAEVSAEDCAGMIDLNDRALVLLTHAVIPYMVRGGHVIEMGSASCFTPLPYFNVYAASKAFVLHYTKALRYELRPLGITATAFCPGWVDTEFLSVATAKRGVHVPRETKPLLRADRVVKKCLRAVHAGRVMCVTSTYTKFQHLLFKILPDCVLTRLWLGMVTVRPEKE